MLKKTWLVWIVIAFGYIVNPVWWAANFQNCFTIECYWVKPLQAVFSIIALVLAIVWWRKTDSSGRSSLSKFASSAVFLAILHMFLNGVGLIGPEGCPAIDPNCNRY